MKTLLILLLAVLLKSCSSDVPFTLVKSTVQNWSAGIKGSGSGTTYQFFVVMQDDPQGIVFDSAWIGKQSTSIEVKRTSVEEIGQPFETGDTVILECRFVNGNNYDSDSPMEFDGAALIRYMKNENPYFEIVQEIKRLDKLNAY